MKGGRSVLVKCKTPEMRADGQKICLAFAALFALFLILTTISVMTFITSRKAMKTARLALVLSEGSGNAAETERPGKETKPAHSMPRSAARVHNKNYSRENTQMEAQEHIEVVGDDYRFLNLPEGSKICHWKESTQSGQLRLKHHTFIIIQIPGLYRVYGQYTVYAPNGEIKKGTTVMLMKNSKELSESTVDICKNTCTRSFSKTVSLLKGDKLWLKSGSPGYFQMSPKHSYFGVNLLQRKKSVSV